MTEIATYAGFIYPDTGELCKSLAFCAKRNEFLDSTLLHDDVIEGVRISEQECEIASAVKDEFCAEILEYRLGRVVITGAGAKSQCQAEGLAELIGYARQDMY